MLKRRGIKHNVLNAKNHEKEAEIIAQAGKLGAVTIATNMAGRGTDIMLGGNAEYLAKDEMRKQGFEERLISEATAFGDTEDEDILHARKTFKELEEKHKKLIKFEAEKVIQAGGLFIMGTERHESRRIDNQLRGRAGRQGDPGESRFFLSLEDDLMRLFGGERIQNMFATMGIDENQPIENKMLTNAIENAQKKVEGRNFAIRKNVLQFDDVMNRQREIIYDQRSKVLNGEDLKEYIVKMIEESVRSTVDQFINDDEVRDNWNIDGLRNHYLGFLTKEDDFQFDTEQLSLLEKSELVDTLKERALEIYNKREEEFTPEVMRELERVVMLKIVDTKWMDHIDAMEELKRGIYLRSYAQKDPAVEFRFEGFEMFDEMINSIREDTVRLLLTIHISPEHLPQREQVAKPLEAHHGDGSEPARKEPVKKAAEPGPNDPCPCGSGKKYKKCCGNSTEE